MTKQDHETARACQHFLNHLSYGSQGQQIVDVAGKAMAELQAFIERRKA